MPFQDLPIRKKVTAVIMLTSITAMLFTAAAFMVYDYMTHRREMVHNLSISSSMIAESSSVMLAFPSQSEANEVLARLRADEHIVAAALYNANGQLFARYPADWEDRAFPPSPGRAGAQFADQYLTKHLVVNAEFGSSILRKIRTGTERKAKENWNIKDNYYLKISFAYRMRLR